MVIFIGQPISLNANGDVSDIYGNLNLDPDFVFAWGGNYNLNVTSPCINAGDPTSPYDADLTIADIGAFPYYDPPVYGCIDSIALNYDPSATVDDGTCCFIAGCTDPMALNYDTGKQYLLLCQWLY